MTAAGLQVASLYGVIDLVDKLTPGLNKAKGSLSSFASDMGKQLTQTGAVLTAGLTLPIVGFLGATVKAASDNENALAQLAQVIKSTGGAAGVTAKAATDLAHSLELTTRFSKDTVLSTEDLLLTFTSIGKDIFPDVTKATLDMSQALGQDTKSSAIQLGKALQDPIKGVTALKRVGVEFTDAQIKQIKALVTSGKTMEAQRLILKEIQKEFGGSAVAAGKTFAGQMDILNHTFTDFQEKVGYIIIPMLEKFMGFISKLVDGLNNLNPNILQMGIVAAIAAAAIGPVLGILGAIATVIGFVLSPIGLLVAAIAGLGAVIALALTGQLPSFIASLETFVGGLVGKIGGFISTNAPKVVKAFEDLLGKVGDWLSSGGLGKLVIGLGDMMGKAANWFITDGAPTLLKGVQGLFKAIQDFIGSDGFKKFAAGLLEVMRQAGDWVISTGWPLFKKSIDALVQLIVTALKPITQGIVDAVTKGIYDAYNAVAALTGQPQVHVGSSGSKPSSGGGGSGDVNIGMAGFAAGGFTGSGSGVKGVVHGGEFVVPEGGALVSRGGGPDTIHIVLKADNFEDHIYVNVAASMREGRMAG